jgi:hypothetical protein
MVRDGDCLSMGTETHRFSHSGYVRTRYSEDEIDLTAAYPGELDRGFLIPPELFAGHRAVQLRLVPARNNQRSCTNLADQFEFRGAIAQLEERLNGIQEVDGSSPSSSTSLSAESASPCRMLPAEELRVALAQVIDEVAAGQEIIVTRHGRPRIRLSRL